MRRTDTLPRISVVTCVCNQEASCFLESASSLECLGTDIEWIVVDDGSDSLHHAQQEMIVNHAALQRTPRYIRLPRNRGLSAARNIGVAAARGDWIVVLDSDDCVTPELPSAVNAASEAGASMLCTASEYFSVRPDWVQHRPIDRYAAMYATYGGTALDPLLWFDFYYHGVMARRSELDAVSGFDETLAVGEDQDVLLRIAERAGRERVSFWPEIGYRYRKNPKGVCATRWPDVLRGYTQTMAAAAQRRGAAFTHCRLAGTRVIDGADVDCYEYYHPKRGWLSWDSASTRGLQ